MDRSSFTIDCDRCVMQHTPVCGDCIVTFICSGEPEAATVIPIAEYKALRDMSEAGLVPELRHQHRIGPSICEAGGRGRTG